MTVEPKVTPNEIRNANFANAMRGYKREDVDEFLRNSADALEDALSGASDFRVRFAHLEEKHHKLLGMERRLKSTLIEAKKTAISIIDDATAEAKSMLEETSAKCSGLEKKAEKRVAVMESRIKEINQARTDYQSELCGIIAEHLKKIESMQLDSVEIDTSEQAVSDIAEHEIGKVMVYEDESDSADAKESTSDSGDEKTEQLKTPDKMDGSSSIDLTANDETDNDSKSFISTEELDGIIETAANNIDPLDEPGKAVKQNNTDSEETVKFTSAEEIARSTSAAKRLKEQKQISSPSSSTSEIDEDTLYKKLLKESASQSSQSAKSKTSRPGLPPSGPDGILVFGRKEDRERSLEENVRVLQDLDSVIDRFAEELEDINSRK